MIQTGQQVPDATLYEMAEGGPSPVKVSDAVKGKKIAVFGLPGAFTPTCSAQHVPGYVKSHDELKAKGIDEVWCMSVNDAFVMGAWGKEQQAGSKVRMMADGSADWTKSMGLEFDLVSRGMGVRSQRFSMVLDNGKVTHFNLEEPGKFDVSSAEKMLSQL